MIWSTSSMRFYLSLQVFRRFQLQGKSASLCSSLKRNAQYVMRPEQECESLVYYGDQNRSMIDVLGLGQDPFWHRIKYFYG